MQLATSAQYDTARGPARMRLIGDFGLWTAEGLPVRINSKRARALLAVLNLSPGHAASREKLCYLLWSDRARPQARGSLRQCLIEIRKALSPHGLALIAAQRETVHLLPGAVESDIDRLRRPDLPPAAAPSVLAPGRDLLEDLSIHGRWSEWIEHERAIWRWALEESWSTANGEQSEAWSALHQGVPAGGMRYDGRSPPQDWSGAA